MEAERQRCAAEVAARDEQRKAAEKAAEAREAALRVEVVAAEERAAALCDAVQAPRRPCAAPPAQRHQRTHSHSGAPTTRVRYIPPRHGRLAPASLPMHPRFKKAREREVEEMTARLQELILSQKMASEEKLNGNVRRR